MPYLRNGRTGYRRVDTSLNAALAIQSPAENYRQAVLTELQSHGPMTADEIAERLNLSILTVRPRLTELRAVGKLTDTGQRRKTPSGRPSIVWKATGENHV